MTDTSSIRRTDFKQAAYDAAKRYKGSLDMIENAMTDYNDGNWHGWNGGECPVHPGSVVDVKFNDGEEYEGQEAEDWTWEGALYKIIAFRVTKPYIEPPKPLEFWINEYDWGFGSAFGSKAGADESASNNRIRCIRVREVIEE